MRLIFSRFISFTKIDYMPKAFSVLMKLIQNLFFDTAVK